MKSMQEEWDSYQRSVYPHGVHPIQLEETKQAFMAGAMVASTLTVSCGDIPDETKAAEALAEVMQDILTENEVCAEKMREKIRKAQGN